MLVFSFTAMWRSWTRRLINWPSDLLTDSLTSCFTVLTETLIVAHILKTLSVLCENPKVHYRVCSSPPLDPILSQINPIHTLRLYSNKIHFNIILQSRFFPSRLPTKILYALLISSMHPVGRAHFILLDFTIEILIKTRCGNFREHATPCRAISQKSEQWTVEGEYHRIEPAYVKESGTSTAILFCTGGIVKTGSTPRQRRQATPARCRGVYANGASNYSKLSHYVQL
jgi:hypothetical protein